MALPASTKLGPYEILALLGAGGMGVVYRARDTRLDRIVALKLLPPDKIADPVRKQRFLQEARAASALNHPNIITIHDFGEDAERSWIVMEYVAGRTLTEVIGKQGLAVTDVLRHGIPIAGALACAHGAGIVHRDLKPGNVMVGENGRVKVLDFGLAKLTEQADTDPLALTRTLSAATGEGVVLGTTSYMSPEQAEGRKVDSRSDIFSFGAVLYEMATGHRAFTGATPISTIAAILEKEPQSVRQLNPAAPRELERVISRCLRKDPAERFQSIDDVRMSLEDLAAAPLDMGLQAPAPIRRTRLLAPAVGIVVLSLAAGFGLARWPGSSAPEPPAYRLRPLLTEAEVETQPAWSPDGKAIAYIGSIDGISQVFFRDLASPISVQITKSRLSCSYPFWSPDGARIYYHAGGQLWSVGAAGGESTRVLESANRASISPNGKSLVFSSGGETVKLWISKGDGTAPQAYDQSPFPEALTTAIPQFSPDGSKIAVLISRGAVIQGGEFWILPFPLGAPRRVLQSVSANAAIPRLDWMRDNRHVVFGAAVPGIPGSHIYIGDIETNIVRPLTSSTSDEQFPAVSPDGRRIAFASGGTDFDLFDIPLNGDPVRSLLATSRSEAYPRWAPSGTQYAYTTDASGTPELWLRSVQEGWVRPLVTAGLQGTADWIRLERPVFSPDGQRVAYDVYSQQHGIWISPVAGGRPVHLDPSTTDQHMPSWSPDGTWIAYRRQRGEKWELAKASFGGGTPVVLVEDAARGGVDGGEVPWSPAGDWIAFRKMSPGLHLASPDGKQTRQLTAYTPGVYDFSKDGTTLYAVRRLPNRRWGVTLVEVPAGRESKTVELAIPPAANLTGFSLHPDGTRFATGLGVPKSDIWLLDGLRAQ